ncbi:MAG: nitroreductase family deazaflavin-dependent oxidoreductase, partial [Solirubrobacteraceae bacterium]
GLHCRCRWGARSPDGGRRWGRTESGRRASVGRTESGRRASVGRAEPGRRASVGRTESEWRRCPGSISAVIERSDNAVRRFMRWTGSVRPISLFYARTLHHLDRAVFRLSGGRATLSAWAAGLPVVMLETTGARSGQLRALPILGFEDDEDLVVIASNYGQSRHPGWYRNLKANPRGRVIVDGVTREIQATEVTDPAEWERLFAAISRAVIVFGAYRRHTDRVGREIPILRLRPVASPS